MTEPAAPRRAAILVSGRGSNMAALVRAARAPGYPVAFTVVISNQPEAPALKLAEEFGLTALAIDHRPFGPDRQAHERQVQAALEHEEVDLVCLAGYLRRLTPWFVSRWAGRMLNIHPSLLPTLPGLDTHARALAAGLKLHGCTVHLVTDSVDAGPILAQAAVPILPSDTGDTLAARVLAAEHALYPTAVADFVTGSPPNALPPDTATLSNPLPLHQRIA